MLLVCFLLLSSVCNSYMYILAMSFTAIAMHYMLIHCYTVNHNQIFIASLHSLFYYPLRDIRQLIGPLCKYVLYVF